MAKKLDRTAPAAAERPRKPPRIRGLAGRPTGLPQVEVDVLHEAGVADGHHLVELGAPGQRRKRKVVRRRGQGFSYRLASTLKLQQF